MDNQLLFPLPPTPTGGGHGRTSMDQSRIGTYQTLQKIQDFSRRWDHRRTSQTEELLELKRTSIGINLDSFDPHTASQSEESLCTPSVFNLNQPERPKTLGQRRRSKAAQARSIRSASFGPENADFQSNDHSKHPASTGSVKEPETDPEDFQLVVALHGIVTAKPVRTLRTACSSSFTPSLLSPTNFLPINARSPTRSVSECSIISSEDDYGSVLAYTGMGEPNSGTPLSSRPTSSCVEPTSKPISPSTSISFGQAAVKQFTDDAQPDEVEPFNDLSRRLTTSISLSQLPNLDENKVNSTHRLKEKMSEPAHLRRGTLEPSSNYHDESSSGGGSSSNSRAQSGLRSTVSTSTSLRFAPTPIVMRDPKPPNDLSLKKSGLITTTGRRTLKGMITSSMIFKKLSYKINIYSKQK